MEIPNCIDDCKELVVYYIFAIIAEIATLLICSWHIAVIIGSIIFDVGLLIYCLIDWLYFGRRIILDNDGCAFVFGKKVKRYSWTELNIQYVKNSSYLFGDSEIPGDGVILSANSISKSTFLAAMTYCRFTHPYSSVFLRFKSESDNSKKNTAKYLYHGFCVDKYELRDFLESTGVVVEH